MVALLPGLTITRFVPPIASSGRAIVRTRSFTTEIPVAIWTMSPLGCTWATVTRLWPAVAASSEMLGGSATTGTAVPATKGEWTVVPLLSAPVMNRMPNVRATPAARAAPPTNHVRWPRRDAVADM